MEGNATSQILRPQSRRSGDGFALSEPSSEDLSSPVTPVRRRSKSSMLRSGSSKDRGRSPPNSAKSSMPPKTKSILNLTSSTLLGIYSPAGYDASTEGTTPWGAGAQTPARGASVQPSYTFITEESIRRKTKDGQEEKVLKSWNERQQTIHRTTQATSANRSSILLRSAVLFFVGLAYGKVITHLHDARNLSPIRIDRIHREDWRYLLFWGVVSVILGSALPGIDQLRRSKPVEDVGASNVQFEEAVEDEEIAPTARNGLGADWNPIVRSIGAFVGIAFAIRKLPWQSTLQVSLTLALVNPVMWYLIDRTRTGFVLSSIIGTAGSAALLGIKPDWVPTPALNSTKFLNLSSAMDFLSGSSSTSVARSQDLMLGIVSYESIGVATWISSVLFCSCVFFGNIGRRLTPASRGS